MNLLVLELSSDDPSLLASFYACNFCIYLVADLAFPAAQETLSALVVKSQLIAHDVGEALDQSSDELVAAMPRCGPRRTLNRTSRL